MKKNELTGFLSQTKKFLKMLKLVSLGFFLGLSTVIASTYSQTTKLSVNMKDASILQLFEQVESQSEFVFIYKNEAIDLDKKVNVQANASTVDIILDDVLRNVGAKYEIIDRQVIITKNRGVPEILPDIIPKEPDIPVIEPQPQRREIRGTVKDKNGQGMVGVNVVVKGTTIGTITDVNGNYTLSVPEDAKTLVYSFIGMESQEIAITRENVYNIVLQEAITGLEELVVVGYGSQKKQSVVGAIVQTTSEELQRAGGVTNLGQALTGNLPGVTTIMTSGEPGEDDPRILIRAMGTWNNSTPLILVDGIERKMNDLDISEVETVSVLKDASATAVFGVKGAEGVILITTKRGKVGKPKLSFDANVNTKSLSKYVDKMDSYDALVVRNNAIERELGCVETGWAYYTRQDQLMYYRYPNIPIPNLVAAGITDIRYGDVFPNVDWIHESLNKNPISSRVNLNISGGTDFAKYFGSLAYTHDADLLKSGMDLGRGYQTQWGYDRFNYRTNLDFNITRTTTLSVNLHGYVGIKKEVYISGGEFLAWQGLVGWQAPNVFPIRFLDGSWGDNPTTLGNEPNPLMTINTRGLDKVYRSQVNTDFILNQKLDFITEGLSIQGQVSYDNLFYSMKSITDGQGLRKYIYPSIKVDGIETTVLDFPNPLLGDKDKWENYVYLNPNVGVNEYPYIIQPASFGAENASNLGSANRHIFYQVQLNYARLFGRHNVGSTFLMNREQSATGSMFPSYREDWVGRVTYDYDNRYLFEANGAYNGSEKFAPKYRFGFFPSVAVGWMASNESFLKRDWLDKLKFRYSIGKVGNDNFVAQRWAYETTWALDTNTTQFGYSTGSSTPIWSPYAQYYEAGLGNPELHWEVSKKQNFGIEVAVLKNRFSLNLDFFKDDRSDIFIPASSRNVPPYAGFAPVAANLGKTKAKGYEIEFRFQNTSKNMLYYWFSGSYTRAVDEIIYKEDPELMPSYQKAEGYPISQFRCQLHSGYVNNWDEVYASVSWPSSLTYKLPGDCFLIDFNGDGVINSFDSAPYGFPERPQNTYNFSLGADYKGFGVMLQFYGVFNATRGLNWAHKPFSDRLKSVVFELQDDIWAPGNYDAGWMSPHFYSVGVDNWGLLGVTEAWYLRLKTAEISYTFSKKWVRKIGLSGAKIYMNGNNIWMLTDMVDDREANDYYRYPMYRRFNLGLNIDF